MKQVQTWTAALTVGLTASATLAGLYGDTPDAKHAWAVHDMNRPRPPIIAADPGKPPSDAVVLFDGSSLDAWLDKDGKPCRWAIIDGAMQVVPGTGEVQTKASFGDCQLHIEFATPTKVEGGSQGRGNSGVFLMGMHEIQVLDCFDNDTYPDGQCSSVYAENPPLVNACRKPGEWQTYDIVFHQPIWDGETLKHPGTVTVIHNGVLTQDNWEFEGLTTHCQRRPLKPYAPKLPLRLQDHNNPMRFRNIWIREIPSRYANTTHGGPAVSEADVAALRAKTAAKLFESANPADANKAAALQRLLEVIAYEKSEQYMKPVEEVAEAYLKELAALDAQKLQDRKGEIIGVRNSCNVLTRNKVVPEDFKLKVELQRIINDNKLEKK